MAQHGEGPETEQARVYRESEEDFQKGLAQLDDQSEIVVFVLLMVLMAIVGSL